MSDDNYHLPPDDYKAPTAACCDRQVILIPVIDGVRWVHLTPPTGIEDHSVVLAERWLDVARGEWHDPEDTLVLSSPGAAPSGLDAPGAPE